MTKKKELYSLTPEHRAQLEPWGRKWTANALNTEAMTPDEISTVTEAIFGLYAAADLEKPKYVTMVASPLSAQIISGVAAAIIYSEKEHSAAQLYASALESTRIAVRRGRRRIELAQRDSNELDESPELEPVIDMCLGEVLKASGLKTPGKKAKPNDKLVKLMNDCVSRSFRMRAGGNQWSGWVGFLSFFRHIAKLDIDYSKWQHYETAAIAGPRYMHKDFCIYSDRPNRLKVENNLPHCADGPSHEWRDGWQLHYWRGTIVPRQWIMDKPSVDSNLALTHPNVEMRRIVAEIIGWERVLSNLSPRVIDKNKDPMIGELLEVDLPDSPNAKFIRVLCGTGRTFCLGVPRRMKTAAEANAWTYGLEPGEMKLEIRT
jgi:hypothetical protein